MNVPNVLHSLFQANVPLTHSDSEHESWRCGLQYVLSALQHHGIQQDWSLTALKCCQLCCYEFTSAVWEHQGIPCLYSLMVRLSNRELLRESNRPVRLSLLALLCSSLEYETCRLSAASSLWTTLLIDWLMLLQHDADDDARSKARHARGSALDNYTVANAASSEVLVSNLVDLQRCVTESRTINTLYSYGHR